MRGPVIHCASPLATADRSHLAPDDTPPPLSLHQSPRALGQASPHLVCLPASCGIVATWLPSRARTTLAPPLSLSQHCPLPTSLSLLPPWPAVSILAVCPSLPSLSSLLTIISTSELPPDARSEDVSKFFDGYGRIVDCRVMTGALHSSSPKTPWSH